MPLLLAILLAAVALPAENPLRRPPRVETGPLARARLLATPAVPTLLSYTRRVAHLPDGHTLAFFSYSGSAKANWLFLLDTRDLTCRRLDIPHNDIASHGGVLGQDGDIYVMPYATGRAYRYRVADGRFDTLSPPPVPSGELTWEAFGARDGSIYFGTYPNAIFGRYEPARDRWTILRQAAPNTKYVTAFSEDAEGRVRCKAWGPAELWLQFDPRTGQTQPAAAPPQEERPPLPQLPAGDTEFLREVTAAGRRFVLTFPSSRLWEVTPQGTLLLRGNPRAEAESWFLEAVPGAVIGIGLQGAAFRYDLTTARLTRVQLPNLAPGGNPLMFVEALSPRAVIGANYSQQNLFRIDPENGRLEMSPTRVARVTGEPMCATAWNGLAYLGIYTHSLLAVYNPGQPFEFGANPREIADLSARYQQTRPRAATTGAGLVFISSDSDYNHLGGALAVIHPGTGQVDVYHHLVRDQNLPTLAFDPVTGLLWGGTDRWGQMRSHPPTQPDSLLYAFDPRSRRVVATLTPWRGADQTHVLGISNSGILVAASGREMALIDTATRTVLFQGPAPAELPATLRRGADGHLYGLARGLLYRWDLAANRLTAVADAPGCTLLTESAPGVWILADRASIYRVDLGR